MLTAEKSFSPQLNKLFAESLYEVGWLEKQSGQSRAALELTTPAERTAKMKAFAQSRFEQAQQAVQHQDLTAASKFIDDANSADPNQPRIINLRGEILMAQKQFDQAEAEFKKALKIDPKFREPQYNLAEIPFKQKDYAKARDRFEGSRLAKTPGADKNQAAQLIKYKIYMTLLLEGKESRAQKMMEQFQFTGDTPALYYAQAAWEFKHNNPTKAMDWIESARKIYSPALNVVFADSFYDLGWIESPALATSPAPSTEAAVAMESAQTESSPAIEPSPIPGASVAKKGAAPKLPARPLPEWKPRLLMSKNRRRPRSGRRRRRTQPLRHDRWNAGQTGGGPDRARANAFACGRNAGGGSCISGFVDRRRHPIDRIDAIERSSGDQRVCDASHGLGAIACAGSAANERRRALREPRLSSVWCLAESASCLGLFPGHPAAEFICRVSDARCPRTALAEFRCQLSRLRRRR